MGEFPELYMSINGERFIDALVPALEQKGEDVWHLCEVMHWQAPFLCSNDKHYAQLVISTPSWLYALTNNSGDGIHVSIWENPEQWKPEPPDEKHAVVTRITSDKDKMFRIVRIAE